MHHYASPEVHPDSHYGQHSHCSAGGREMNLGVSRDESHQQCETILDKQTLVHDFSRGYAALCVNILRITQDLGINISSS